MVLETRGDDIILAKGAVQYSTLFTRIVIILHPKGGYPDGGIQRFNRIWNIFGKPVPESDKCTPRHIFGGDMNGCMEIIEDFVKSHANICQHCFDRDFLRIILSNIGTEAAFVAHMQTYLKTPRPAELSAIYTSANTDKNPLWNFNGIISNVSALYQKTEKMDQHAHAHSSPAHASRSPRKR